MARYVELPREKITFSGDTEQEKIEDIKEKKMIGITCADIYIRFPEIMEEEFDDLTEFLEDNHIRYECATDIVYDLQQENKELKHQLKYLRSGEYLNQLRFERDMLQDLVDNGEVSKEDKEFIDMTHRNTELLEQLQERDNVIDKAIKMLEINIEITKEQPSDNVIVDNFMLDKYQILLSILKGEDND